MENQQQGDFIEQTSVFDFEMTLEHLTSAIAGAGLKLFARIDHAAAAWEFGMEMPPTIVLIYGHPKGGTPIMLAHPDAALDLPLKLLVREKPDGKTSILFRPIELTLASAGVAADQAVKLAAAQKLIAGAISVLPASK